MGGLFSGCETVRCIELPLIIVQLFWSIVMVKTRFVKKNVDEIRNSGSFSKSC